MHRISKILSDVEHENRNVSSEFHFLGHPISYLIGAIGNYDCYHVCEIYFKITLG